MTDDRDANFRQAILAVALRPRLWAVAFSQLFKLAAPGWWRHWPPLPLPDPAYVRFRLQTAFGDPDRAPDATELIDYLQWCRSFRRLR